MAGATIRAQVKLEGGKAFAEDFNKSASAVKAANAEVNYLTTALNKNEKSQDALAGKTKALQNAFNAEQTVIDSLTTRIEELKNMTGVDTTKAVDDLTTELYKHKTAQAQLGDQVDDTAEDFSDFGTQIGVASAIASKAFDVIVSVAEKVWDIGKGAVEYNAQMESYSKTIEAFFKTSGQSAEEAAANTEQLIQNQKQLSVSTGIATDKLIDANKVLIASGVEGDKAQQAISALSKAIVATGGGNEELSRMASNLMQIVAVGKASSQDMKQFSMAGVDVYGLMAETTGKTVEQLKEMDITFDMIVEALNHATSEGGKFFEASKVGASTLQGQLNLLDSTVKEGLGTAFEPVNEALRDELIPAAIELIEEIDWNAIGDGIAWAVGEVTDFVMAVKEFKDWYQETFGPKAQATADAFVQSNEDVKQSFYETGQAVEIMDEAMYGAVEASKGLGNHMVMEFDGMEKNVTKSMEEIAGEVKNELIEAGWDAMAGGETVAVNVAKGINSKQQNVSDAASALKTSAKNKLASGTDAYTWGSDMGQNFADGLNAKVPAIGTAAAAAANAIRYYMEHSEPKHGPLKDEMTWMPHMMENFASGIYDNLWRVQDASMAVAETLTAPQMITNYNGGINMTVNAAQGQNVNQLVDEIMVRIQRATTRRTAVWA